MRRPKLLLLDEPLTNLDAKLRHDTRAEFKRLHRELGMTMLYATPDQLEALTMGQRIGVMREGRIVQVGTPHELYARPQDTYAARMVGAPAINLVPGQVPAATVARACSSCRSARSTCRQRRGRSRAAQRSCAGCARTTSPGGPAPGRLSGRWCT